MLDLMNCDLENFGPLFPKEFEDVMTIPLGICLILKVVALKKLLTKRSEYRDDRIAALLCSESYILVLKKAFVI